jgi:hypothetical protein
MKEELLIEDGKMTSWLDSLPPEHRELVLSSMRELDAEAVRLERKHLALYPPPGTIGVGAAWFDPWIRSYAIFQFLMALRKGETPEKAEGFAKHESRYAVEIHNQKRKGDVNWKRWEGTADETVERCRRRINDAVSQEG